MAWFEVPSPSFPEVLQAWQGPSAPPDHVFAADPLDSGSWCVEPESKRADGPFEQRYLRRGDNGEPIVLLLRGTAVGGHVEGARRPMGMDLHRQW